MALARLALTSAVVMVALTMAASAQSRGKALVIGQSAYQHLPPLASSSPEIGARLKELGFAATSVRNLDIGGLRQTIERFSAQLQQGETALVFFSGYALQFNGDNYLAPIGFDPNNAAPVTQQGYSLSLLTENLEKKRPGLVFVMLDAGWTSPALQRKASGPGLTGEIERRDQLFLLLSNAPDRDGIGGAANQPPAFSLALLESFKTPGLTLTGIYESVRRRVMSSTETRLSPTMIDFVTRTEPFLLVPAPAPVVVPPPPVTIPKVTEPVGPLPLNAGTAKENPRDLSPYVWIPAGEFKMGCVPNDKLCAQDESPQRPIKITEGFWMMQTEVTAFAYDRFSIAMKRKMPAAPIWNKKWKLTDRPITEVSWTDADAYCKWAGGRLPSEAEWEYAARAGVADKIYVGGDNLTHDDANYLGSSGKDRWVDPGPVRSFSPNPWNLYDMAGNVREWTSDVYDPQAAPRVERVIRGGSYNDGDKQLRISMRAHRLTELRDNQTGFRCALPSIPTQ